MKKITLMLCVGLSLTLGLSNCEDGTKLTEKPVPEKPVDTPEKPDDKGGSTAVDNDAEMRAIQKKIVEHLTALPNAKRIYTPKAEARSSRMSIVQQEFRSADEPVEAEGEPIEVGKPTVTPEAEGSTKLNGVPGHWVTTTHKYKVTHAFDEQILLDPHVDVIYPGCVLKADQVLDGRFGPVTAVPVGPITFSISAMADSFDESDLIATTVTNPRISDFRKQQSRWANMHLKKVPSISMQSLEVLDKDLNIESRFNATVGTEIFDLKTKFGFDYKAKSSTIIGKFIQRAYSVSTDAPKTETIFARFIPDIFKTRPVYISNINFGRMAFVAIQTNEKLVDVQAAVDFMLKKNPAADIPVDVGIDSETKAKAILKNCDIQIVLIGGSASTQRTFVEDPNLEKLRKFMAADLPMNELVPVNYQLRYVHDNSLARILMMTEYPVTTQQFVPDFDNLAVEFETKGFTLKGDIDKTNEIFGTAYLEADGKRLDRNLFDIKNWIRMKADGNHFNPYNEGARMLYIKKRKGETAEDFLKRRIIVVTDLQEKQPIGQMSYGQGRYEMSIAQLIALSNSGDPTFTVTSQVKNYWAKAKFGIKSIAYRKGEIKIIDAKAKGPQTREASH